MNASVTWTILEKGVGDVNASAGCPSGVFDLLSSHSPMFPHEFNPESPAWYPCVLIFFCTFLCLDVSCSTYLHLRILLAICNQTSLFALVRKGLDSVLACVSIDMVLGLTAAAERRRRRLAGQERRRRRLQAPISLSPSGSATPPLAAVSAQLLPFSPRAAVSAQSSGSALTPSLTGPGNWAVASAESSGRATPLLAPPPGSWDGPARDAPARTAGSPELPPPPPPPHGQDCSFRRSRSSRSDVERPRPSRSSRSRSSDGSTLSFGPVSASGASAM